MNMLLMGNLEAELELAAEVLSTATHPESETGAAKRWHYLDAWLYTQSTGWQRVDFTKDLLTGMPKNMLFTRAEAAAIKSTWQFKWGAEALVRCWVWSGSQWFDCNNYSF